MSPIDRDESEEVRIKDVTHRPRRERGGCPHPNPNPHLSLNPRPNPDPDPSPNPNPNPNLDPNPNPHPHPHPHQARLPADSHRAAPPLRTVTPNRASCGGGGGGGGGNSQAAARKATPDGASQKNAQGKRRPFSAVEEGFIKEVPLHPPRPSPS
eukprot:scaffold121326_cov33-Phaeocystis_antarctica.AAC.1